ncbi:MAG TPA: ABC transporter permease [Vicinamibacterales bacterium]|jgi:putative ABC transport system permease protein|nr:ABC transporter permease [Vicinamibacterales bacterium]
MPDWHAYVRHRLPPLPCSPEREAEIVEELALQFEQVYRRALSSGASDDDARAEAESEVSDWNDLAKTLVQRPRPEARVVEAERVERPGFVTEMRYALRALAATPGFTIAVVLTLALGAGVTTTMFSLVDRILLAPLPYANPDQLVLVQQVVPPIRDQYPVVGANLRSIAAWRDGCRVSCGQIATIAGFSGTLSVGGEPQGVTGVRVTANTLDLFGIRPILGRGIQPNEEVDGSHRVIVLSYDLWQQRFGADPSIVGRMVRLDSVEHQVLGVLPASPRLPLLQHLQPIRVAVGDVDVLVPFVAPADQVRSPGDFSYVAVIRLADESTAAQAREELTPITHRAFADVAFRPEVLVHPLGDHIVGKARRPLWLLLAAVLAMLLVACVNVANLVAGRWLGRRRELAIRVALGARETDLLRHVGAEAAWLAAAGAVLTIGVAYAALRLVVSWAPVDIPRVDEAVIDVRVLIFGVIVTTVCTLPSCVLPVRRVTRLQLRDMLDTGAHGASEPRAGLRLRSALVGLEVATTVALLIVAGLLLASFARITAIDRGFVTEGRIAVDLNLSTSRYATDKDRGRLLDRLLESVKAIPGVDAAAVARKLPLEGEATVDMFLREGEKEFDGPQRVGSHLFVSPDYFRALQLRLLAGRTFTDADRQRRVAVVSDSVARALWPGQDPIGQRFARQPGTFWEVIGVVANTYTETLERQPGLMAYVPYWERSGPDLSLVIRTFGNAEGVLPAVRHTVQKVDADLALLNPRTMNQVVENATATRRFQMWLTTAFAIAGLVIACLGIYGVVSASVLRRRGELAVRRAIGASAGHITCTVLIEALAPVVAGLAIGVAIAAALGSIVAALLFEVSPRDPIVFSAVAALILLAAVAACAAPLAKALRTSPILALRGR